MYKLKTLQNLITPGIAIYEVELEKAFLERGERYTLVLLTGLARGLAEFRESCPFGSQIHGLENRPEIEFFCSPVYDCYAPSSTFIQQRTSGEAFLPNLHILLGVSQ